MGDKHNRVIVTLLHGTFARGASWTQHSSSLCRVLNETLGNDVLIERLEWSGRNLVSSRTKAGEALHQLLKEQRASNPGVKQIVIGHSHGGSVIAYALKHHPGLANSLCGVVFLSTPFLSIRLRPNWESILRAISLSFAIWLTSITALVFIATLFASHVPLGNPAPLFFALWLFVTLFSMINLSSRTLAVAKNKWNALSEHISTTNLPVGKYAFFRLSGDEAAGALSVAQMVNWALGRINSSLSTPIKIAENTAVAFLVPVLFIATIFILCALSQEYVTQHSHPSIEEWIHKLLPSEINIITIPYYSVLFIWASTFLLVTIYAVTSLIGSLAFTSFGRFFFFVSLFFDIAVEPLPVGKHTLWHQAWNSQSGEELSHSATYANPQVLQAICTWILEAIKASEQQVNLKPRAILVHDPALIANMEYHRNFKVIATKPGGIDQDETLDNKK